MKDIILLHGALGSSSELKALKDVLDGKFSVHLLDFNGHGDNDDESIFYIDGFQQDLSSLIRSKGLDRPFVFGYSMGGYVALYHEIVEPGNLSGIITLGTKFEWNPEISEKEAGFLDPKIIMEKVPEYAKYLETIHSVGWVQNVERTQKLMLKLGNEPLLREMNLKQIKIPVTISRGNLDKMVSEKESLHIASLIPNAEYLELEGVKHPIRMIDPIVLKELILKKMK